MGSLQENLIASIERIAYTVIALVLALYLLNVVLSLGAGSYGLSLLNGISVFMVVGSIVLMLFVAYSVFNALQAGTRERGKRQ